MYPVCTRDWRSGRLQAFCQHSGNRLSATLVSIVQDVCVDPRRHSRIGVPCPCSDLWQRQGPQQDGNVLVPKIVEPEALQPELITRRDEAL